MRGSSVDIKATLLPKRFSGEKKEGVTEFHHISLSENIDASKNYLKKYPESINANWPDGGGSPLHILLANEKGELACQVFATILEIEKKGDKTILDFSIVDREGKSLLILAVKARQWRFVTDLFNHAHVRTQSIINMLDESGRTAVHYAALYGELEIVKLLIAHGAHLNIRDKQGVSIKGCTGQDAKMVRDTLFSIEIHPDRSISAQVNVMTHYSSPNAMLQYVPEDIIAAKKHANQHAHEDKRGILPGIISDFESIISWPSGHILATAKNLEKFRPYSKLYCDEDLEKYLYRIHFDPQSVADYCLQGQLKVNPYLESLQNSPYKELTTQGISRPEERKTIGPQLISYSRTKQEIKPVSYQRLVEKAVLNKVIDAKEASTKKTAVYCALEAGQFSRALTLLEVGKANPLLETMEGDTAFKLANRLALSTTLSTQAVEEINKIVTLLRKGTELVP